MPKAVPFITRKRAGKPIARLLFRKAMLPGVHHLRVAQNGEHLGEILLRQLAEQQPLRYECRLFTPLPAQPVRVKHRRFFAPQQFAAGKRPTFSAIGKPTCFHAIEREAVARFMRKAAARACAGALCGAASAKEAALADQRFRFVHACVSFAKYSPLSMEYTI